jgi:hypothetical protein
VCEQQGDRLVWSLLRFRASALVGPKYTYGPLDRPHGFERELFREERPYMIRTVTHVWTMEQVLLTSEVVVGLLRDAIRDM